MHRECRYEPPSAHPLVLALCQIRLSPVPQMDQYIPAIQEAFRRRGFPIERAGKVGLRYIDVVRASGGKDFRFYLRPGLHGVPDQVFQPGQHLLHTECRGRTVVGGNPGTMVVRIVQNDQGSSLPPDLVDAAPSLSPRAEAGELVTLIDMDHFVEGNFNADPDWVVARAYEMHDHIIETFHDHVVTEDAIKEWK